MDVSPNIGYWIMESTSPRGIKPEETKMTYSVNVKSTAMTTLSPVNTSTKVISLYL